MNGNVARRFRPAMLALRRRQRKMRAFQKKQWSDKSRRDLSKERPLQAKKSPCGALSAGKEPSAGQQCRAKTQQHAAQSEAGAGLRQGVEVGVGFVPCTGLVQLAGHVVTDGHFVAIRYPSA